MHSRSNIAQESMLCVVDCRREGFVSPFVWIACHSPKQEYQKDSPDPLRAMAPLYFVLRADYGRLLWTERWDALSGAS